MEQVKKIKKQKGPKKKLNTFLRQIKIFLKYVEPYKKELKLFSFLSVLGAMLAAATPLVVGRFFDALSKLGGSKEALNVALWLLLLWVFIQILSSLISWWSRLIITKIEYRSDAGLNLLANIALLKFPAAFHKETSAGRIRHTVQRAAGHIGWFVNLIFNQYASSLIGIITGIFMAFYISPRLATVLLAGMILYILMGAYLIKDLSKLQKIGHRAWRKAYEESFNSTANIFAIKAFGQESFFEKLLKKKFDEAWMKWLKPEQVWANIGFLQGLIVTATQGTIFLWSIFLLRSAQMSIGDLVAMNAYVLAAFGPVVAFMNQLGRLQNGLILIEDFDKMLSKKRETYHPEGAKLPKPFIPSVSFKDVYFAYSKKAGDVLKGVSFDVKPGQSVALVGESGVGKTTTIELLLAYYFPRKGSVKISGVDSRKHDLEYLRKHITLVPQETVLFNDTILRNMRFADLKASEKQIWEALEKAQLADFVRSLPKGLKTIVGERGVKLSVGQKQRISIARAFLKDAPILILDEPTSALDAKTEKNLRESFDALAQGRTTFVIAHRLSTVRKADKILVFDKGRIVEEGSHEELLKKENGVYKNLHEFQLNA